MANTKIFCLQNKRILVQDPHDTILKLHLDTHGLHEPYSTMHLHNVLGYDCRYYVVAEYLQIRNVESDLSRF